MTLKLVIKISALILFVVTCAFNVYAQSYPVQVTVSLKPPYSAFLTDYSEPGSQKFTASFLLRDLNVTDYKGKLRLTIEGVGITIRTKANYVPLSPITLYGGESLTLFGEDLEEYFNPNNLDFAGISRSQYEKGAKLPEGVYRFTLEMLDYNRSTLVSNKGTAVAWVILNDPPLLNLPRNDTKAKIIDPTNIAFTWTPRHTGSPNSAFTTEYIFKLVEIWPATRNPYDAFLSQQPLYEITTSSTQIIYGPAEPALIPGRKYAWQVQAKDIEDRDLFKNQGKSEVYVFQFGDELGTPENFRQDGGNSSVINLRWEPAQNGAAPQQYRVRYKKKNDKDRGVWYESVTDQLWIAIPSLQSDTEYEMQIRAEAKPQYSEYSTLQTIRTDEETTDSYSCGTDGVIQPSTNTNPLFALAPGEVITCRNFKLLIIDVKGSGGNYTGTGWLKVPWFNGAGILSNFSGQVNTDRELVVGGFESVYNQGSPAAKAIDEAHKIGEEPRKTPNTKDNTTAKPDYTVPGTIKSISVNDDGKIVVVDTEGNESTYNQKKEEKTGKVKATVIADSAGNSYTVGEDGKVTKNAGSTTQSGSNNPVVSLSVKDKIVVSILGQFKEEMAAWLRNNGKGGDIDEDVLLASELPVCFKRDAGQIRYIMDEIIPYYEEHPPELVEKIETEKTNKELFDKISKRFNNVNDVDWSKLPSDEQEDSRNVTGIALVDRIAPLVEFYEQAAPLLDQDGYKEAIAKLKAIYNFFKTCNNEGWESYEGEGIIPYCFWRDQNVPSSEYYSNADLPFLSGLVDGGYREAEGLYHLPQLIRDISKIPSKVLYAYTAAYIQCSPGNLVANAEQLDYVLRQLAENEKGTGILDGLVNRADNWWNDYEGQKEELLEYFTKCENAKELRDEIEQLYAIATNWEEIKKLSGQVLQHLNDYWNTLETTNNVGRYERGRLVVPVVSTVMTLGPVVVSKIDKIKNLLKTLRTTSEDNWHKIAQGIGKALGKSVTKTLSYSKLSVNLTSFPVKAMNDDYIDVIVHFSNGKFKTIIEQGGSFVEKSIEVEQLANTLNQIPGDKSIRLLSCNDIATAQELSKQIPTKTLYASDGWVDLFDDGIVKSEYKFKKLLNGDEVAEVSMDGVSKSTKKIRLGNAVASEVKIPADLVNKLSQEGANKLTAWVSKNKIKYKGLINNEAATSIINDLNSKLNNHTILEVIEDTQGRLLVRTETKIYGLHDNVKKQYDIYEYSRPYRKSDYPLSANRLTPDFSTTNSMFPISGNQRNIVRIKMTGRRSGASGDFIEASKKAGMGSIEKPIDVNGVQYTWHHLDDFDPLTGECTMQLVRTADHIKSLPHTGSVNQYEKYNDVTYK
ncbi:HNH endonuclease [Ohtaekwangia koreensis]|nr:HNH endonuclease [Ohtaekwangia koreensis]